MTKEDIELLFAYDRWANGRALQQSSTLSTEQFTRNLGGSFSSVRGTLVHIVGGEWIWLQFWKLPSHDADALATLRARRETILAPAQFPTLDALRPKWQEIEKELWDFVSGLTSESLEQLIPVRNTQLKLVHTLQHLANHSTYHRGQLALMIRQLGAEPLPTDFHVFLAEGRS